MAAITYTGAISGVWSVGTNWDLGRSPLAGDDVHIAGTNNMTMTNDLTADISFASLTFDVGCGAATISGNRITLAGNFTDSSSNNQIVGIAIILNVATCTVSTPNTVSVSGVISQTGGTRALTKTGAGILLLSGANTYQGANTVTLGTLKAGVSAVAGVSGPFGIGTASTNTMVIATTIGVYLDLNGFNVEVYSLGSSSTTSVVSSGVKLGAGTLTITHGNNINFYGTINGDGGIIKAGAGTVNFMYPSYYTGGTTVTGGLLSSQGTALTTPFGTGTITLATSGMCLLTTGNSISNNIVVNNACTISNTTNIVTWYGNITLNADTSLLCSNVITFAGNISGTGKLINITTSGTTPISGNNTFTGQTQLQRSVTSVASFNSVNGGTPLLPSSSLGCPTTVANGTITAGLTTNGGSLTYTGLGETTDRVLDLAGTTGGLTLSHNGAGLLKFTSNLTASGGGAKTLTLTNGQTSYAGEISGIIPDSGGGATSISKGSGGIWVLSGTANSYTGTTSIAQGNLIISSIKDVSGGASSVGAPTTAGNGTIAMGSTTLAAVLTYVGGAQNTNRIINLSGTTGGATIDQSGTGLLKFTTAFQAGGAGIKTLVLQGSTTGTGEISAAIVNNSGTNKTSVTKTGTSLWTLSGISTYTGATTISAGTLSVTGTLNAGSAVAVNNGGILGGTGTINGAITVAAGGVVNPGVGTTPGTLTAPGGITFNAASIFAVDLDGTGPTADKLAVTGTATIAGTLTVNSVANSANGKIYTIITATVAVSGTFAGLANGETIVAGGRAFTVNYTATTVTLTDTTAYTIQDHTWTGGGADANIATAGNWDAAGVPKQGDRIIFAGSTRPTVTNNFTAGFRFGAITFAAGAAAFTINAGNAACFEGTITNLSSNIATLAIPATLGGNVTIATTNGAALSNNIASSIVISGILSGPGGITKTGSTYTLTLSGANTYSGDSLINAGNAAMGNAAAFGATMGTVYFANGTSLWSNDGVARTLSNKVNLTGTVTIGCPFSGGFDPTINGVISGTGGLNIVSDNNSRAININGVNTFSGGINVGVTDGATIGPCQVRIRAGSNLAFGTGTFTTYSNSAIGGLAASGAAVALGIPNNFVIAAGCRLNIGDSNNIGIRGNISGATGALYNMMVATCTLYGTNTYAGATGVTLGTLNVQGSLNTSSAIAVSPGAVLAGNGSTGAITVTGTGAISPSGAWNGAIGSTGILTNTGVVFSSTSIFNVDINSTVYDTLATTGTVTIAGDISINTATGAHPGDVYTVIRASGGISGTFSGRADGDIFTIGNSPYTATVRINYTSTTVTLTVISHLANRTWVGLGADDNWTTALNWGFGQAPLPGDNLDFQGSTRLTPNNDFTAGTRFWNIAFDVGSGNFVIGGNSLELRGGASAISSAHASGTITLNTPLTIDSSRPLGTPSFIMTGAGTLIIGGSFDNGGLATTLTVTNGNLVFSGNISGAGLITMTGGSAGSVTLSGNNTFTGGFTLNAASTPLNINSATAMGAAASTFNFGANNMTINNTSGGPITLTNNNPMSYGQFTFTGTYDLNLGTGAASGPASTSKIITVTAGKLTFGGVVAGNVLTIVKSGAGTLAFTGTANTYSGATQINQGTLQVASLANVSSACSLGTPTTAANGTIALGSTTTTGTLEYIGSTASTTNRVLNLAGTTGGGVITMSGTGSVTFTTVAAGFTATGVGVKTFTVNGSGSGAFIVIPAAVIDSTANATSFVKDGTCDCYFTAACSYSGSTSVLNGDLFLGNATAAGSLATSSAITVTSPGILNIKRSNAVVQGTDFAATISGTGTVQQSGAGALTMNGNNSFGAFSIAGAGIVTAVTNNNAMGAGTITFDTGSVRLVVTDGLTLPNNIILGPNSGTTGNGLLMNSGSGNATINGTITVNNVTAAGGHFAAASTGSLTLAGVITSSVTVACRNGIIILSGGGTGYTDLSVAQGTARVGAPNGIATTASVSLGASGSTNLDLNGFAQEIVGVTKGGSAATIGNSSIANASTLTTTGSYTYAGVIQDVLGSGNRTVALTVNGGTAILSGTNTHTGTTTVASGNLTITGSCAGIGGIAISSGGTLNLGNGGATGVLPSGGTLSVAPGGMLFFNRTGTITSGVDFPPNVTGGGEISIQVGSSTQVVAFSGSWAVTTAYVYANSTLKLTGGSVTGGADVDQGGILSGSGTFGTIISVGMGTVSPGVGSGIGLIAASSYFQFYGNSDSNYSVDLNGTGPTADKLTSAAGASTIDANLVINSVSNPVAGKVYTILHAAAISGEFLGLPNMTVFTAGGRDFQIKYTSTDVTLTDYVAVAGRTAGLLAFFNH